MIRLISCEQVQFPRNVLFTSRDFTLSKSSYLFSLNLGALFAQSQEGFGPCRLALARLYDFSLKGSAGKAMRNFEEVENGTYFRASQLPPTLLRSIVQEKGIKVVINLKSTAENQGSIWSQQETALLKD